MLRLRNCISVLLKPCLYVLDTGIVFWISLILRRRIMGLRRNIKAVSKLLISSALQDVSNLIHIGWINRRKLTMALSTSADRHGNFHEVPIMLRRHEPNEADDLIIASLLQSNPLNHRSHKSAVLAPAHLSAEQRLPCGILEVLAIDNPKTTSCSARLGTN